MNDCKGSIFVAIEFSQYKIDPFPLNIHNCSFTEMREYYRLAKRNLQFADKAMKDFF